MNWAKSLTASLAAASLLVAVTARAQEPARSADSLVDSIGVVTHWGYLDTPYAYAYDKVKALLAASGIRHLRDSDNSHEDDLFRAYGIKTTFVFGPGNRPPAQQVQALKGHLPLVDMAEGPNEVDVFRNSANYDGQGFPQGPRHYQHDLYVAIKSDPVLAHIPVISFSLGGEAPSSDVAPETDFDYEVMHSYAGGAMPSLSLMNQNGSNIDGANRFVGPGNPLKPIIATESGYHTALNGGGGVIAGVQFGVSEAAQAKYLPRQFCEYLNHGIVRDFTYELVDEFPDYATNERQGTNAEACFGIIRHDLTPKPAYLAEKNLIGLLNEATWDVAAQRWAAPAFQPGALDFTLSGDTRNLHHTLLQKSNGDFYLILWQEVSSFDTTKKLDIANPPVPVILTLNTPMRSAATFLPGTSTAIVGTYTHPKRIPLNVPDELLIVRLTPAHLQRRTVPRPADLMAAASGTTVTLRWRPVPEAAGYFVSRMGADMGSSRGPSFTDLTPLPGTGYTYTVRAYDAAGNVSTPTRILVTTPQVYPHLVITDLTWSPAQPKPGDAVTFTATIKNQGTISTPGGVIHGVAFHVDGAPVNWSDTSKNALAPGASRTLTANNGVTGLPTWTATTGSHTVTAIVDDSARITEIDRSHDTVQRTLTVP